MKNTRIWKRQRFFTGWNAMNNRNLCQKESSYVKQKIKLEQEMYKWKKCKQDEFLELLVDFSIYNDNKIC